MKYRILIDRHENGRSKITLSRVIEGVTYECSVLCDADDKVSVNRLESLLDRAERRNAEVRLEMLNATKPA